MKRNLKYLIYALLTGLIVYACVSEFDGPGIEEKELMAESRNWFESNKGSSPRLRSSSDDNLGAIDISYTPKWEYNFTQGNGNYNVVEYALVTEGRLTFLHSDVKSRYDETGDERYKMNSLRYVFRIDKHTGEQYGFLMAIIPDLEFLESSGFRPFRQMSYLERDKDFGGQVLYYSLDGSFINGWVYKQGEVIASTEPSLEQSPEQHGEDQQASSTRAVQICTRYVHYYVIENCYSYYVTYEGAPAGELGSVGISCSYSDLQSEYFDACFVQDTGGGLPPGEITPPGTGGGSGGGSGSGTYAVPQERTDCVPASAINAKNINNVLKNTATDYEPVKRNIDQLRDYAMMKATEYGMAVEYIDGQYFTGKQPSHNNAYIGGGNSQNSVAINSGPYTYLIAHTHPGGNNAAPSPSDASIIGKKYKDGSNNIQANVVFAYNGEEYMVYVSDRTKFANFCNNSSNRDFFNPDGSLFKSGSVWDSDYNAARNRLIAQRYADNDAQSYALSYVLSKYNTGMVIYHRKDQFQDFKEQNTLKNGNNYTPQICK